MLSNLRNQLVKSIRKRQLKKKRFSIIANNCWGFQIYQWLDIPYQTPFVGCGCYPPCYLKLLQNLEDYLKQPFSEFTRRSKYFKSDSPWPIGILAGEIEVHFAHYESDEQARKVWTRRLESMNWDNEDIYVKMCDRDSCTDEDLKVFHSLPFKNKISFTAKPHPEYKENVQIKMPASHFQVMPGDQLMAEGDKYFDFVRWVNGDGIGMTGAQRVINTLLGKY